MARTGIIFGILLCGITAGGLVATLSKDPELFASMMFGIPVLFCGVVALNPHRRKNAMRTAGALTSVGVVIGIVYLIQFAVEPEAERLRDRVAIYVVATMTLACLVFSGIVLAWLDHTRKRASDESTLHHSPTASRLTETTRATVDHDTVVDSIHTDEADTGKPSPAKDTPKTQQRSADSNSLESA